MHLFIALSPSFLCCSYHLFHLQQLHLLYFYLHPILFCCQPPSPSPQRHHYSRMGNYWNLISSITARWRWKLCLQTMSLWRLSVRHCQRLNQKCEGDFHVGASPAGLRDWSQRATQRVILWQFGISCSGTAFPHTCRFATTDTGVIWPSANYSWPTKYKKYYYFFFFKTSSMVVIFHLISRLEGLKRKQFIFKRNEFSDLLACWWTDLNVNPFPEEDLVGLRISS